MFGIASIVGLLASKGIDMLSDCIGNATEKGVEAITDKVKEVTGIDLSNKEEVASLTPEQALELKKFETQHAEFLLEMRVKEAKLYLEDRQDARDMQKTALKQDDKFSKRFVPVLGAAVILVCLGYAVAITFIPIPENNIRFADTTLGFALGTGIATILNFFFGTSHKRESGEIEAAVASIAQQNK